MLQNGQKEGPQYGAEINAYGRKVRPRLGRTTSDRQQYSNSAGVRPHAEVATRAAEEAEGFPEGIHRRISS